MTKKLLIIGAGSAMFTRGLVSDLIDRSPGGYEWSIALCDIDRESLHGAAALVRKMVAHRRLDIEITASTDRRDLLPGADYVVTTIGVGGRRAWEQDVFIPRKYGIYQPVGDTSMPGGISRAMRMVPAMVEIAKDIRKYAPNARFINYSNPMAVICRALHMTGDFPVTGLCHGVPHSERMIANFMGYEFSRFTALGAGINHCTFLYDFRYDGRCVTDDIRAKVEKEGAPNEAFAWEIFLKYGAYPAPGDRHISEFFTEYFPGGAYYGKKLGVDAFSFEGTIAGGDKIHADMMAAGLSSDPLPELYLRKSTGEEEQLIDIIDSIERDRRAIFYANVPNGGAIANLSPWAVVEFPTIAGGNGIAPIHLPSFPNELACFTNRFLAVVELTAEAALRGDRQLMAEAIMMGGYISDKDAVRKMTDELLLAQKAYLPQF